MIGKERDKKNLVYNKDVDRNAPYTNIPPQKREKQKKTITFSVKTYP